jgi:hypothetical protein
MFLHKIKCLKQGTTSGKTALTCFLCGLMNCLLPYAHQTQHPAEPEMPLPDPSLHWCVAFLLQLNDGAIIYYNILSSTFNSM